MTDTKTLTAARAALGDDHAFMTRAIEGAYGEPAQFHASSMANDPLLNERSDADLADALITAVAEN